MNLANSPPVWIASTLALTVVFWTLFGTCVSGCVDAPLASGPPQAKIVATWDPLACGAPHRVVVELEDEDGRQSSSSTACPTGGVTIDARQFGLYVGHIYAWELGTGERSRHDVQLVVDAPVVRWEVETPK